MSSMELNDNRIKYINSTITNLTTNINNLELYLNLLKKTVNDFDETKSTKYLIESIDNCFDEIKNDLPMLNLNKLKLLKKTSSGRLNEFEPFINMNSSNSLSFTPYKCNKIKSTDDSSDDDYIYDICNDINIIIDTNIITDTNVNTDIDSPNFSVYNIDISKEYGRMILCNIALKIFKYVNLEEIGIDESSLKKFIGMISNLYRLNPYHNLAHAIMVLQFTYILLKQYNLSKYFTEIEIFAILMSAYVHDIDHPGHTNAFEQKIVSPLAIKYNDHSVLENHHCSTAFYIMHLKGISLLENLSMEDFKIFREMMVQCIMSTDMKYHNAIVEKLKTVKSVESMNKISLGEVIVHIADLSNMLRPFDISFVGSKGLRREFENQVKKEEELNLPVMSFMRIETDEQFYNNEISFGIFVIKPLLTEFKRLNENIEQYDNQLDLNVNLWRKKIEDANLFLQNSQTNGNLTKSNSV